MKDCRPGRCLLWGLVVLLLAAAKVQESRAQSEPRGQQGVRLAESRGSRGAGGETSRLTGAEVMRRVLRHKQERRSQVSSYEGRVYSRYVLEKDTSIVHIQEYLARTYWRKGRGMRHVLTASGEVPATFGGYRIAAPHPPLNFYDDNIRVGGFTFVGPTHPEALRYYRFALADSVQQDGQQAYAIEVSPAGYWQPAFVGRLLVSAESYALLSVALRPGRSVFMASPVRDYTLSFEQHFQAVDGQIWVPERLQIRGSIDVGTVGVGLPMLRFEQSMLFQDYQLNVPVPDSLYAEKRTAFSGRLERAPGDVGARRPISLSDREDRAYARLEGSGARLSDVVDPEGFVTWLSPLSVILDFDLEVFEESEEAQGARQEALPTWRRYARQLSPEVWFDRVEAFHLALTPEVELTDRLQVEARGGYKTGPSMWTYGAAGSWLVGPDRNSALDLSYSYGIDPRYGRGVEGERFDNGLDMLGLGNLTPDEDYFDYYGNERLRFQAAYALQEADVRTAVGFRNERHFSVEKHTDLHLYGDVDPLGGLPLVGGVWDYPDTYRVNPAVQEGMLRSLTVDLQWGDGRRPLGELGQRGVRLSVEHSAPALASDFTFTKVDLQASWRVTTFLDRRPLPGTLDLYAVAGGSTGELPLQRVFTLASDLSPYEDFGTFGTLDVRPYEGDQYLALFWQHDFQTIPFELLGLHSLAERGLRLTLLGAHGRTWVTSDLLEQGAYQPFAPDGFRHEVGITLDGILGVLSLEVAKQLGGPELDVSIDAEYIL